MKIKKLTSIIELKNVPIFTYNIENDILKVIDGDIFWSVNIRKEIRKVPKGYKFGKFVNFLYSYIN